MDSKIWLLKFQPKKEMQLVFWIHWQKNMVELRIKRQKNKEINRLMHQQKQRAKNEKKIK